MLAEHSARVAGTETVLATGRECPIPETWHHGLLLERPGFRIESVTGDHTDEPARAEHETLVFLARKP